MEKFAKIPYILYVFSLSEGFFWPKILKINRALFKLFMHMKTHFSSISTYRDLSLCDFIFLATLMSMPIKFFVMILIFGGSRAKNAWFIMYIIYIFKLSFFSRSSLIFEILQNFGQLLLQPFFDLMTFFTWWFFAPFRRSVFWL